MKRITTIFSTFAILLLLIVPFPALAGMIQYTYDDLNRLIKAEYDNGITIEYTYDEVGNRLSKKIGPTCDLGDMNCDGVFDIFDLMKLINCILGQGSCDYGDLNGDGEYDIFDLMKLINKILAL